MNNNYSLYLSYTEGTVIIILLKNKEHLSSIEFKKNEIDKHLVFESNALLKSSGLLVEDITSIYIRNVAGNWNANRLLFTFAKTWTLFKEIELFFGDIDSDIYIKNNNLAKEIENLYKNLKLFKKVNNKESFLPIYT